MFADEIIPFFAFFPSQQIMLLHDEGLTDTSQSINVARRIYLSMMASNCSEERSFSKLSLMENILLEPQ